MVLRLPILYGKTEWNGESTLHCLIDVVRGTKEVKMDGLQKRYPTLVDDVARVLKDMVVLGADALVGGYYHFASQTMMTKFEMCG